MGDIVFVFEVVIECFFGYVGCLDKIIYGVIVKMLFGK